MCVCVVCVVCGVCVACVVRACGHVLHTCGMCGMCSSSCPLGECTAHVLHAPSAAPSMYFLPVSAPCLPPPSRSCAQKPLASAYLLPSPQCHRWGLGTAWQPALCSPWPWVTRVLWWATGRFSLQALWAVWSLCTRRPDPGVPPLA